MNSAYAQLMNRLRDLGRLASAGQLLAWDQETYMPPKGVPIRADVIALISGLAHEHLIDPETGRLLDQTEHEETDDFPSANVRETRRAYDRAIKVPTELVKTIARTSALAKSAWAEARKRSDFAAFAPHLAELIDLKRRMAEHIGYETEPYDALLDEYEPGAKSVDIADLFAELRRKTVELLERIIKNARF